MCQLMIFLKEETRLNIRLKKKKHILVKLKIYNSAFVQ